VPASPKSPTKRVAAPRAKRVVKAAAPPPKPFLRFYHSESLREKTLDVLDALEEAQDSTRHRAALADVVVELTRSGLDYYFLRPLKLAKVGFFVEQSANLGMAGATQVLGSVIRTVMSGMDNSQLRAVCNHIRQLMT